MWNGNNESITPNMPRNYMYNNMLFILDEITDENCAHLIGDLAHFVTNEENFGKKLTIIINSPGGNADVLFNILGLLNLGRLNSITIVTMVMGLAASAASILAACGDRRLMTNVSRHFIHFGSNWDITTKYTEIDKIQAQNKDFAERMLMLYTNASAGKLTKEELLTIMSDERGYLSAEDSLEFGLCDSIIENELAIKNRIDEMKEEVEDALDEKIQAYVETILAKPKKVTKKPTSKVTKTTRTKKQTTRK